MNSQNRLRQAAKAFLRRQGIATKAISVQPIKTCTINGLSDEAVKAASFEMSMRGTSNVFMIMVENGLNVRNKEFKAAMQEAKSKGYKIALINW